MWGKQAVERMRHRRQAPEPYRQGKADADADHVDESAGKQISKRVSEREGGDDVGVIDLVPAEGLLEVALDVADDSTIDVAEGGGEEEQHADPPAEAQARRALGGVIERFEFRLRHQTIPSTVR